jgi:putative cell wall-binding protein
VSLILGAGAIGGVIAGASGVAAAAVTTNSALGSGSAVASTANPTLTGTGTDQTTAALTLTLNAGTYVNTGDEINLSVFAAGAGTVIWAGSPTATPNSTSKSATGPVNAVSVGAVGTSTLTLTLTPNAGQNPSSTSQTITVTGLEVTTTSASGAIEVAAQYEGQTTTNTTPGAYAATFTGSPATIGTVPAAAPNFTLQATSTPNLGAGLNGQTAGNWTLTLGGKPNGTPSAVGQAWTAGNSVAITVNDDAGNNCTGSDYVFFSSNPTVSVVTSSGVSVAPTVSAALGASTAPACSTAEPNLLLVTFTNSGTITQAGGSATISISGVTYSTGASITPGDVEIGAGYYPSGSTTAAADVYDNEGTPVDLTTAPSTEPASSGGASNASVAALYLNANSPAVTVAQGSLDASISPISLVESKAGQVTSGYVCLTLAEGSFNTAATPKVAVTGGNGTVASSTEYETTTNTDDTVVFQVLTASTGTAGSTYTVSGLAVNAPTTTGPVDVSAKYGVAAPTDCGSTGTSLAGQAVAYTVGTPYTQIYGADADGTAAAELEREFPPGVQCPGNNSTTTSQSSVPGPRPVVLATDQNYPDALAGAYLARYLGTGELLTPTASLSSVTLNALRQEGITNVYVVGGPLAISQADISQLEATDVYNCGGSAVVDNALGQPVTLSVTQIYGQTEYDTAQDIAEYAPTSFVGTASFTGAYSGTNSSGGNGMYNDTAGNASTTALSSAPLPTAILATGTGWQDAMSASALSYAERFPILLTTPDALSSQAQSAITALGIHQVIVMGGPLAISNSVVTSLQGMGVSVLRIAGQDYTDTADQLANFEVNTTSNGLGLGWDPINTVTVARGDFYTDGLAGAVVAANGGDAYGSQQGNSTATCEGDGHSLSYCTYYGAGTTAGTAQVPSVGDTTNPPNPTPLLETFNPSTLGNYLPTFLGTAGSSNGIDGQATVTPGDTITNLVVLGGPLAVTPTEISQMEGDL